MKYFLILFGLSLAFQSEAVVTFERTYGGISDDYGYSVQQTQDGGYIITGNTRSFGDMLYDIYLIKTDSLGDTLWVKTYGGTAYEIGKSVQQTRDDGYIIAGHTKSFGAGELDIYLIKTDSVGDTLWTKTYGGTEKDFGYSVQQTQDDGYIIVGCTHTYDKVWGDVWLIKIDSKGDTSWTKTHRRLGGDIFDISVQQTKDGGYIIAASDDVGGKRDVNILKTNSLGDTIWTKTYGGTEHDGGKSVQQTSDGGYITTGYTYSFGAGNSDVYLIKTDSVGDTLWTKTHGGTGDDRGYSVQQTQDSEYIIAGYTNSFGGDYDIYLIKTDSLGDILWTKTHGDTLDDYGYSVQQTKDGGYIIAGYTQSFGAGRADVYLIKTDSLGNVGIEEDTSHSSPNVFCLAQNQPNPFSFSTSIRYTIPKNAHLELTICNILGQLVRVLVSKEEKTGVYTVSWNGKDDLGKKVPTGIYFYRLATSDYSLTRKMIVLQ